MSYSNKIIKRIYDSVPYKLKVLFTSIYGLQQRQKRYGKTYFEQVKFLNDAQYWDRKKLEVYQNNRLRGFMSDIYNKIPYYNNNPQYKILSKEFSSIHDFPILPKQLVKQNLKDYYNPDQKKIVWGHTSGTTGSPMTFPISLEAYQKEYAFRNMHYQWSGLGLHNRQKIAMCSAHPVSWHGRNKPPYWTYDMANNHLYFSTSHLSGSNFKYYIKKLEEFDPLLLHGHPSSIYLLALAYKKYGTKKLSLKSVYTSSESLLDFQRQKIESIFQMKVFNWYGTSEMTANIVECEKGELHLKEEHSFVEILNSENQPCGPGETGRIISTNFNNLAFPLIRYDIGDTVVVSKNQNSKCGRSGLLIDSIEGRIDDYIFTPDGRIVGRMSTIFRYAKNVIEAQFEQHSIEEVIMRIVRGKGYSKEDEIELLKAVKMRLGNSIRISIDYVDQIPRTSNGKFRFIISKIDPSYIKTSLEV